MPPLPDGTANEPTNSPHIAETKSERRQRRYDERIRKRWERGTERMIRFYEKTAREVQSWYARMILMEDNQRHTERHVLEASKYIKRPNAKKSRRRKKKKWISYAKSTLKEQELHICRTREGLDLILPPLRRIMEEVMQDSSQEDPGDRGDRFKRIHYVTQESGLQEMLALVAEINDGGRPMFGSLDDFGSCPLQVLKRNFFSIGKSVGKESKSLLVHYRSGKASDYKISSIQSHEKMTQGLSRRPFRPLQKKVSD
ncbi:hypothetical protein IWX90DRAFT_305180 [Phyllosticta citrichinensis]|uniref:Uncharacterized protein n=1 Tax=Phyllosticta citrichinensis TaxID=1130410 RepID=A0ABR1XLA7_9PEZI